MPGIDRLRRIAITGAALLAFCAAAPAVAAPTLWVVRSSTATVYLFGTVHNLPPNLKWRTPLVEKALASSQTIWTESESGSLPYLARLIRRYGLSQQGSLRTLLPKRYRSRYETEMHSAGLQVDEFGHIKPWLAEMLLSGSTLHHAHTGGSVETDLLAYAHRSHKNTRTFESADSQFAVLADLPVDAQLRALELDIDGYPSAGGQMTPLVQAWMDGDEVKLDALTNRKLVSSDERYFDDIIVRRDEAFAQTVDTLLQNNGTAFIALGAAHLCGGTGVQALLKNYNRVAEQITVKTE
jgi:uncharacterized protein